jgi:hypothetical protein
MLQTPVVGVKFHPAVLKVAIIFIAPSDSGVPAAEADWPEVVVSQKLFSVLPPLTCSPTRPPTLKEPETLPVLYASVMLPLWKPTRPPTSSVPETLPVL